MGFKVIAGLGLFLALVLLISSEVAAREIAETAGTVDMAKESEKTNEGAVNDAKYPGGGYGVLGYECMKHYGGYPGRGGYGGRYPGHGGYGVGGRGGYCRYGCCGRNFYRGGCRCCTYAGERPDADVDAKPHN
ncbi:hypothetical protein CDL12_01748 [Handroanthus impetiginosus]|uniref:Glycine rich protein n=1 Tax=Handroanthus impetiginosus TaxID=429701 RepID=A0A2G9I6Y8_9LAMI|nr:hypothetical protein CDL12_01748 [Handroanthus impetiginosus]